jgi:DNA-binding FrmR family transcriptional regulator
MNNKVLHRLKIVRGHLDKVIAMVSQDKYCIDILTQSSAVQSALKETDALILEDHLRHCVTDAIKNNKNNQAIAEIIKLWKKRK